MHSKAVFLDRDDTINYDPGYLGDPHKVKLYPGVGEGIKKLKNLGFKIIVISNQSGVTRGYITTDDVDAVNKKINELLKKFNTAIDDFFYCPYHPDYDGKEKASCRKPSPQMIFEAAEKYSIDLKSSYFIGDQITDAECGNNAGLKTILVLNKISENEINNLKSPEKKPNFVAIDFLKACKIIEEDIKEKD